MAGEKTKFHEASRDIFRKVQAIERAGFTFLEVGEGLGRNWGISPIRLLVDTQLHHGISIRTVVKHVKFPKTRRRLVLQRLYPTILVLDTKSVKNIFESYLLTISH